MSTDTRYNPINLDVINQAVAGIDSIVNAEVRESYTGRGMTKPCVGVVVSSTRDLLALGASIAYVVAGYARDGEVLDDIDDAIDPMHHAEIDSMGRDLIVYWPGVSRH